MQKVTHQNTHPKLKSQNLTKAPFFLGHPVDLGRNIFQKQGEMLLLSFNLNVTKEGEEEGSFNFEITDRN